MAGKGEQPQQQRLAHKDAHFTVLGFTAVNVNPIMCAIIFAAKTLEDEWVLGLDPFAEWVGDENNFLANSGKNKRYPQGGPGVSTVDGVNLPTYCCASEN